MTQEFAGILKSSLIERIATFVRDHQEIDRLKDQIKDERKALAGLTDEQLRDIGLTREQAKREAGRSYDDVPEHRLRFKGCSL
ncbi:MAG: DUF1127 domain-containing protein [Pseudomonadota bacterium]